MPHFQGTRLTVLWGDSANESLQQALEQFPAGRRISLEARMRALIERLANQGLRSPDQFRSEGGDFYAIRASSLRAYGWFASTCAGQPVGGIFIISHFAKKSGQKLSRADKGRMSRSKATYEQTGEL
jgi:hypothetical protein